MAPPTTPKEVDLAARRGVGWPYQELGTVTIRDSDGVVIDITASTITGAIRLSESLDSTQQTAITITKTAPTAGVFTFKVLAATTAVFTLNRTYFYHILATGTWTGSVQKIIMQGQVYVEA